MLTNEPHSTEVAAELLQRVQRIEEKLIQLVEKMDADPPQEWYSTADTARLFGKAEFTVREWCRLGRVYAEKRSCGRGNTKEWIISHEEIQAHQK